MKTTEAIDVDNIWRALGPWGKYQWKQLLIYLFMCCSWPIHAMSIVFIGYRPNYHCKSSPNDTRVNNTNQWKEYDKCSVKLYTNTSAGVLVSETGCENGWEYAIPVEQSFVTQWNLVCETEELAELSQSLMTIGMLFGAIFFPSLSDRYGRKIAMAVSNVCLFGTALGTSFTNSYTLFTVLRILNGAMQQGGLSGAALALESFPSEARMYAEPLALTFWTSALCVMSPIAYFLRNYSWRYLQLTYALMSAWSLIQWWIQDESLRWLIANGKLDEARQVIKNACKWNKKDYATVMAAGGFSNGNLPTKSKTPNNTSTYMEKTPGVTITEEEIDPLKLNDDLTLDAERDKNIRTDQEPKKLLVRKYTVFDIFRHPRILRVSLIMWFTWITDSLTYYGLFLISSDLYGDRYINFFLAALCEFPGVAFELYAFPRLGRPFTCMVCHATAAAGLVLATLFITLAGTNTAMMAAATAFTLVGKMGITAAFSTSYLLTPELYPTNLRNAGLGVAAVVGKIGAMVAPFSRNLVERALWAPGAIFAVFCLGVVIGMLFIPETNGIELPQTMEELSIFYKKTKRITVRINNKDARRIQNRDKTIEINDVSGSGI